MNTIQFLKSLGLGVVLCGTIATATTQVNADENSVKDALTHWLNYERPAEYEALVTDVRPVMRDGSELSCTLVVPAINGVAAEGAFPGVINNVGPYALLEVFFVNQLEELATLGYQGLTCRVRGSGDSDGEFTSFGTEDEWRDNYDLVEWLAAHPGSNGRIAFEGASYGGMTSLQAAIRKPPHLVTVVPQVPASDLYRDFIFRGGVKSRPYTSGNWPIATSLMNFPGMSPWRIWEQWYAHPTEDSFWVNAMPIHWVDSIEVPMLIAPGWADDVLPNGGIRLYEKMVALGKADNTWLYSGDWDHDMASFQRNVVIAWLDYWLQQREDAPLPPSHVVSYEMGSEGDIKAFQQWPPAGVKTWTLALNPDGTLAEQAGSAGELSFAQDKWSGLIGSPDMLVFRSAPLTEDIVIAGDMTVSMQASYDGEQATLHARLLSLQGDAEQLIKEGWLNVSHRHSHAQPEPIPVNQPVQVSVDIGATHHRIPAGSQLVLTLSGVDTWDWQPVANRVNATVAVGAGGSVLSLTVLSVEN